MGILPPQHRRVDFGAEGYGFLGFDDAYNAIDPGDPPVGHTFKINGEVYELGYISGVLEFMIIED